MSELLEVHNLSVSFDTSRGEIQALRDVSLTVKAGEVLAVVGETGCGKSVLCKSVLKLLPDIARIKAGRILLNGVDITGYRERDMCKLRGSFFSMVFQNPLTALNPSLCVGAQIAEAVKIYNPGMSREAVESRVMELMHLVRLDHPNERMKQYPHHLSGGMRQRAALIRTLALEPDLLLLDEPFSALDYQTRLNVGDDIGQIIRKEKKSAILVTHDLSEAISLADRVIVLSGRPATIRQTIPLIFDPPQETPLARRNAPEFKTYFNLIWKELNTDE